MNRTGFALSIIAVVASAAWAYHVNYRTKTAFGRVEKLRAQIAAEREAVEVLRVEWAYLNAPDRLARLVALNNDQLGLEPMAPRHFDEVAAVPFPPRLPGTESEPAAPTGEELLTIVAVTEPVPPTVAVGFLPVPRPASLRRE